jgi:hypothetical protein
VVTVDEESDTGWWFVVKTDGSEGEVPGGLCRGRILIGMQI